MAAPFSNVRKGKADKPPLGVFYGVAGVGKTSLACEAPNPIFMRTLGEDYPTGVEVDEFPVAAGFRDVKAAIEDLAYEEHGYSTFVLDSLDGLETLVWRETCARNKWDSIEAPGFGKGYVAADELWHELLAGLHYLRVKRRMAVILLGHTEIKQFNSPITDPYSRYSINLHKRAADLITDGCDLIGFVNYRVTVKKVDAGFNKTVAHGEGGGTRVIHVEERPGFVAKNRFNMPAEISFKRGDGWNALAKYLPDYA